MSVLLASFNERQFLFLGDWGPAWLAFFGVLALLVLLLTWFDLREMSPWRRRGLLALRTFVLAVGIFLAAEPALEMREVSRIPNHVAVLFDDSASGQLPADGQQTRQDVLRGHAERLRTDKHAEKHVFDVYRFGDALHSSSLEEARQLEAKAPRTHILQALERLRERYPEDSLGGVVLLSDGSDNATLGARVPEGQALDESTLAELKRLRAPIHTVEIANNEALRDIAIRRIRHDEFAFVRNAISIDVELQVHGYQGGTVPVRLRRNGEILQTRTFAIEAGVKDYRVEFEFVPELIGKEIYSVDIPVEDDDMVPANNRDFFVLRVIRDKIRVLQVVGEPSWDVRFFRQLMKGDPNVELISFFILRDYENVHRAPDSEMSLIPFPTHELFHEQLGSFDLVVLQNFSYGPFGMAQYLQNIKDYVNRGGGLLVLGGDNSFSAGGYARTPIEDVLPVRLGRAAHPDAAIDLRSFRPQLTDAGARHPITRLEFDPRENQALWEKLPPMHGSNIVQEAKPDAVVLATHPHLKTPQGPMPVLAISDQNKGRSMAFTVDASWRWNYDWVLEGGSSRPYTSFWNSAIRWLIRDPALNLLQLDIGQTIVESDAMVDVQIRAFRADYTPAANTTVRLKLQRRPLDDIISGAQQEVVAEEITLETDDQGRARWTVQAQGEAAWRVEAQANVEAKLSAEADEIFLSVDHSHELRELEARNDLLQQIAEATGGQTVRSGQALHDLPFLAPRLERVHRRKTVDVWSSPWVLIVFVLLLALEWQLRRRWGRL